MASPNDDDLIYRQGIGTAALIHKSREMEPLTNEEQQALNNWLNGSLSNKSLFESLHHREQLTAEVKALLQYDDNAAVTAIFRELNERPPSVIRRRKMMVQRWSAAASLFGIIGIASWFFIQRNKPVTPSADNDKAVAHRTVTTPHGGQQHVDLPDGSEVWLSTASSITYPGSFTGNTREVAINGEAYLKVAKDKTKPFRVTAGNMKVEVTGTEFNVMAYNDEDTIRTTLFEGSVKVSGFVLKPGEQAALARTSGTVHIEKPNLSEVAGWRTGQFNFYKTNMADIMRQIARWYDVRIEYRGSVAGIGFTGQISRKENIQDLLYILSDTRKVHFELKDSTTIVVIPGPR